MKKIISMALILSCITIVDAQINKKNKINTTQISDKKISGVITLPKSIATSKLKNLKPQQIANLPAATFDKAALSKLKTSKHWEISANKMRDKDMFVVEYFGKYEVRPKYIQVYPEIKYYPHLDRGQPGFLPEYRHLILKFSPEMGKRYRMLIKLKPGNYRDKKIVTETGGGFSDAWYINDQYDEVMFDFLASSQTLRITPIIAGYENYYVIYEPLEIEKITIDKVE